MWQQLASVCFRWYHTLTCFWDCLQALVMQAVFSGPSCCVILYYVTRYKHVYMYCIALIVCGSKFLQIAVFDICIEKILRIHCRSRRWCKVSKFPLKYFCKWHRIRENCENLGPQNISTLWYIQLCLLYVITSRCCIIIVIQMVLSLSSFSSSSSSSRSCFSSIIPRRRVLCGITVHSITGNKSVWSMYCICMHVYVCVCVCVSAWCEHPSLLRDPQSLHL